MIDLDSYLQQEPDLLEDRPGVVDCVPALVAAREAGFALLPEPPRMLLDIGPACGWATLKLSERYSPENVTCLTLFDAEAEILRGHGLRNVTVGDMHAMPADWAGRFGIVRASHVLEHSPAPVIALREFARVLRPGGVLQITIPNADGYVGLGTDRAFRIGDFGCHPFMPDARTLIEMLRHPGVRLRFDGYHEIPQTHEGRIHYYHCTWMASKS